MPPRRSARPIPPDVDVLRTALGQGKLVRVGIAPSDQFPDGVTGRVRRIGQPDVDGDEFIFVEVPVGGAKDVLPFALIDLIGAPARRRAVAPGGPIPFPAAAPGPNAPRPTVPSAPTQGQRPPAQPTAGPAAASARGAEAPAAAAAVRPGPKASPAGGRGRHSPVSITISTSGDESASWRIEAKIGAKTAVRPTPIPPTRVWEIVQSLGEPKLTTMVQSLLDDHRRATQARADALAAELSALQAELKSFPE